MSNIGRSNEWKSGQVKICLDKMLEANPKLYDLVTDTIGFAYWFTVLCIIAEQTMWSVKDAQEYLKGNKKKATG